MALFSVCNIMKTGRHMANEWKLPPVDSGWHWLL